MAIIDLPAHQRFSLSEQFLGEYKQRKVEWGPLGEITFRRTYSREKEDGTQEEWWETVRRVVEGTYTVQKWHCRRFNLPWDNRKAQNSAQNMFDLIFTFRFTPSGRGLWMMGTDYVYDRGSAALNNCGFVSTEHIKNDFADPFCWLMDMSMLGVGVGGNTDGAESMKIVEPRLGDDVHVVEDTREAWVELVRRALNSYVGKGSWPASIDYSNVRPEGTLIRGFGGTASGPEPLKKLVEVDIPAILDSLIGSHIDSTAIVDLFNVIGVCVVSGNVRRSAEIMIGDPHDADFINMKDPVLCGEELASHRWASNNSVYAEVGMDYRPHARATAQNGEPGYVWMENARKYGRMADPPDYADTRAVGVNPCGEQTLEDRELCCLVETYPSRHDKFSDYKRTLKYAYLYAKTVTLIPTHSPTTNAVQMRNRRIGTSQSGIIENIQKIGRQGHIEWCDNGYKYLRELDVVYSDWLCVPRSRKITSVKPSGTVSLLPGVTPGIHYPHSLHYYRTIRVSNTSPLVKAHKDAGYRVEEDKYSPNTSVIYFPVKERSFDRSKDQVTMWEQLENASMMQEWWADNQVSITVTFNQNEAKDIARALDVFQSKLKAVSFLPIRDHQYEQAPYIEINEEEYDRAVAAIRTVNYENSDHEVTERFCDGDICII